MLFSNISEFANAIEGNVMRVGRHGSTLLKSYLGFHDSFEKAEITFLTLLNPRSRVIQSASGQY